MPSSKEMMHRRTFFQVMGLTFAAAASGEMFRQGSKVEAQEGATTYDLAWLRSIATQPNAIDQINIAWDATDNWKAGQTGAGTYDIPAHSVVIGSKNAGNDPSFENLGANIWYTSAGGRFGTSEGYRAFQLDGAVEQVASRPNSVSTMEQLVLAQAEYGDQIAVLDMEWSSSPNVINRWGSSGPLEVMTAQQLELLRQNNSELQPVVQVLPGNTMVWGELVPGDRHIGLRRVAENIYATTGNGGTFVTLRGFRAMQFPSN